MIFHILFLIVNYTQWNLNCKSHNLCLIHPI